MNRTMESLASRGARRVAIYGAGDHTRLLCEFLGSAPLEVAALLDDNAKLHGTHLGPFRIYDPDDVDRLDVDAIIISTDAAEEKLWQKRHRFERRGIPVRRLYGPEKRLEEQPVCT